MVFKKNKCELCGSKVNVSKTVRIIDGKKIEQTLCEKCLTNSFINEQIGSFHSQDNVEEPSSETLCSNCGRKWQQVLTEANVGCPECYNNFSDQIEEVLQVIQGTSINNQDNIENIIPGKLDIVRLKMQLKEAIQNEDFELAAQLRDQLQEIE